MVKSKWDSVFLSNLHYFYAKTDGTYEFPNSAEGDLLKQAKKEIEAFYTHRKALQPVIHLTYSKIEAPHCSGKGVSEILLELWTETGLERI